MAFSTTGTSGGEGLSSEINVTPLIDVLLVLLIIFMVIVPAMPHGLKSSIPSNDAAAVVDPSADRAILVEVKQGQTTVQYFVDGVVVESAEEVSPRLHEILSRRSLRQVLLKADAKLDFGVIAGVIDAGKAAGVESIGLVTPGADRQAK